jgi:hypothetical protein
VFVDAIPDTNPERNVKSCESNYAKSKATCSNPNFPQSHYECMDGENLVRCTSTLRDPNTVRGGTHKSDQCDPQFTDLLNNALSCAITAYCDDPVVGPSNIEDTAHGLQNIVHKKGKLSRDWNEIRGAVKILNGPCKCQQASGVTSSRH